MRDSFTRRGVCHECANPPWGDASSCGHIRFLVEQQRKPHPIGVILGSQVCKKALAYFACLVLVSVHVMTQHAVGVRIGRRHVRAVFYTKIKQQGTITSNFAATRAPMLSLLLPRNISARACFPSASLLPPFCLRYASHRASCNMLSLTMISIFRTEAERKKRAIRDNVAAKMIKNRA